MIKRKLDFVANFLIVLVVVGMISPFSYAIQASELNTSNEVTPLSFPVSDVKEDVVEVDETLSESTIEAIIKDTAETTEVVTQEIVSSTKYTTVDKTYTVEGLTLNEVYTYSLNSAVTIKFTKLPETSNYLTIEEVVVEGQTGYEFKSNMADGTFEYELTLPNQFGNEAEVVYSEERSGGLNEIEATIESNLVKLSSNHFTVFYVINPNPAGNGNQSNNNCTTVTIGGSVTCYATIQAAVNASVNGDTINIAPGIYNEYVLVTKSITLNGSGKLSNPAVDTIIQPLGMGGQAGIEIIVGDVKVSNLRIQNVPNGIAGNVGSGIIIRTSTDVSNFVFDELYLINNTGNGFSLVSSGGEIANLSITDSTISNNLGRGIKLNSTNLVSLTGLYINASVIQNNGNGGIYLAHNVINATITGNFIRFNEGPGCGIIVSPINNSYLMSNFNVNFNQIYGNSCGISNVINLPRINAKYNYWGHSTGPTDNNANDNSLPASNPNGEGESVYRAVDYSGWLISDEGLGTIIVRKILTTENLVEIDSANTFDINLMINSNTQVLDTGVISDNGNLINVYNNPGNLSVSQTFTVATGNYSVSELAQAGYVNVGCAYITDGSPVFDFNVADGQTVEVVCFNMIDVEPSVSITAAPSSNVIAPGTITLTANPVGGNIPYQGYSWTCNTGETSATSTLDLSSVGTHECSVILTDYDGDTAIDSGTFTITADSQPTVTISANPSATVTTPTTIQLTANVLGGNGIISYDWTCNTGENGATNILNLSTIGGHTCIVTVTDSDGDTDNEGGVFTINPVQQPNIPNNNNQGGQGNNGQVLGANVQTASTETIVQDDAVGADGEVLGLEDQVCNIKSNVKGFVFTDKDFDNQKDSNESGVLGAQIVIFYQKLNEITNKLEDITIKTLKTNSSGMWETTLCPGSYKIRVNKNDLPDKTALYGGDTFGFDVFESKTKDNVNFAVYQIVEESTGFNWWIIVILLLLVLLAGGGYAAYENNKRKSNA